MDNTQLYHWGIKGMKWGVRRYQNSDGSLTPAGKKRYGDSGDSDAPEKSSSSTQPSKPKSVSEMSDAELRAAVARLQLEQQYKNLLPKEAPKVSAGKKFVDAVVKPTAKNIGSAVGEASKSLLKDYLIKVGKEKLGLNEITDDDETRNKKLKTKVELLTNEKKLEELMNPKEKSYADRLKETVELLSNEKKFDELTNPKEKSAIEKLRDAVETVEKKKRYKELTDKDYED